MAVGAAGVIGAGASYAGAKKQAGAAKNASAQQMGMFNTLNAQQQPFIRSGYGAMGKLNTLLGIGGGGAPAPYGGAGGGPAMVPPVVNAGPTGAGVRMPQMIPGPSAQPPPNLRLRQLLALRAANGDTEAGRILGSM